MSTTAWATGSYIAKFLLNNMANKNQQIDVEINPAYFVFSWQEYQLKVPTLVSIDLDKKQLVAVGEKEPTAGVATIALFSPEQNFPAGIERLDLLQAFWNTLSRKYWRKKFSVLRPKIVFHGEQQLNRILCGYQRSLLEIAALAAGAKEVSFE